MLQERRGAILHALFATSATNTVLEMSYLKICVNRERIVEDALVAVGLSHCACLFAFHHPFQLWFYLITSRVDVINRTLRMMVSGLLNYTWLTMDGAFKYILNVMQKW